MAAHGTVSTLDLDFNEDQQAIADSVVRWCESRCDDSVVKGLAGSFSAALWQELANMGLLTPGTPEAGDDSGALAICAISEALGRFVFPGPVAASYLAAQVLDAQEREQVMAGQAVVSLGTASGDNKQLLMPFAQQATLFLLSDGTSVWRAEPAGAIADVQTLGGEPWGRVTMKLIGKELPNSARGLLMHNISVAAFLAAAGLRLVKETSEYANIRKQFGKTLSEFQGVAHPLADAQISLTAAQQLARAAASCVDAGKSTDAQQYAAGAAISARRAALKSAYICHQVYAGIGITLEGPAFHITRRIRQLASQPPGDATSKQQLLKHIGLGKHG